MKRFNLVITCALALSASVATGAAFGSYAATPAIPESEQVRLEVVSYVDNLERPKAPKAALRAYADAYVDAMTFSDRQLPEAASRTLRASSCVFALFNPRDASTHIERIREIVAQHPNMNDAYGRYLRVVSTIPSAPPEAIEC